MKIGIIGAGHIGGTLARRLTAVGHEVSMANSRGPDTRPSSRRRPARRRSPSSRPPGHGRPGHRHHPHEDVPSLPRDLFDGVRTMLSSWTPATTTPAARRPDRSDRAGTPESRWVADQLGRPVMKAFNNIYARHLPRGQAAGAAGRIALPVAGDDPRQRLVIGCRRARLRRCRRRPPDESWRQQPGTPVYCTDLDTDGLRRALAQAKPGRGAEFRAEGAAAGRRKLPGTSYRSNQPSTSLPEKSRGRRPGPEQLVPPALLGVLLRRQPEDDEPPIPARVVVLAPGDHLEPALLNEREPITGFSFRQACPGESLRPGPQSAPARCDDRE